MIAGVRSDPSMAFLAVVVVVAVVLLSRHGRTWWHRHTGQHHPARLGRLLIAGLALLGLGALTAGMALGAGGDTTAGPQPDLDDDRVTSSGSTAEGPVPAAPEADAPITGTAGS